MADVLAEPALWTKAGSNYYFHGQLFRFFYGLVDSFGP